MQARIVRKLHNELARKNASPARTAHHGRREGGGAAPARHAGAGSQDRPPLDRDLRGTAPQAVRPALTGCVSFTEAAEADVDYATTWYAEKRPELSLAFLEAMNEVVERIAKNPLAFPVRVDDVRQANLARRFPYALWFLTEANGSVVIAALHHRRDRNTVRGRKPPI